MAEFGVCYVILETAAQLEYSGNFSIDPFLVWRTRTPEGLFRTPLPFSAPIPISWNQDIELIADFLLFEYDGTLSDSY